jgi:hypothetical protein
MMKTRLLVLTLSLGAGVPLTAAAQDQPSRVGIQPAPMPPALPAPAPVYQPPPAPGVYQPPPAPGVYQPAPAPGVYQPAPMYQPAPGTYQPTPGMYQPTPGMYQPGPPPGYMQPGPAYAGPPPTLYRQRAGYAALARGLSAGGGVLLAFGIFSLMGGGITYGLSAGGAICGTVSDPCNEELNASYGLFAAGALMTSGGIAMIIAGTVFRFRSIFGQSSVPRPSFAFLPAAQRGIGGGAAALTWRF